MRRSLRSLLILAVLLGSGFAAAPFSAPSAHATIVPHAVPNPTCDQGTFADTGALYMYCKPLSGWNGNLIVWAHGYTNEGDPLGIPVTVDGVSVATLSQLLGYAFAATSYRVNGLAILPGVDDMSELVQSFPVTMGVPQHVYIVGASEGGIVTALSIERNPQLYTGALSACGPIGSFPGQLNYWGNFRVLFDYFFPFPSIIPTNVITIPTDTIDNWSNIYEPEVTAAVSSNMTNTTQLINTAKAPTDPNNYQATAVQAMQDVMSYNVFATNNGIQVLNGIPFSNTTTYYTGSLNDPLLNQSVYRISASPLAIATMQQYQTSGLLTKPMVTIHTTGDDVIPYWHELLYSQKAHFSGQGSLLQIAVHAFGHCNFTVPQVVLAFFMLLGQTHNSQDMALMAQRPIVARLLAQCGATWRTAPARLARCSIFNSGGSGHNWADQIGVSGQLHR